MSGTRRYLSSSTLPMVAALPPIRGTWYFVDPTAGSAAYTGKTPELAFANLSTAYDACVTGQGDGICLLAVGTTAATTTSLLAAAITWDKHGITVVGLCSENKVYQRARVSNVVATLTLPTLINLSGNNNRFENVCFINEGTDALALGCITVTGSRNVFKNCHIFGGWCTTQTANEFSLSLGSGAQDNYFEDCVIGSDTIDRGNNANCELLINGTTADGRNIFNRCTFLATGTAGGAHVAVKSYAATSMGRHMIMRDCDFVFYTPNKGSDAASAFGGTAFNTARIYLTGTSGLCGYAVWDAAGTTNVMVCCAAGSATGGLGAGG